MQLNWSADILESYLLIISNKVYRLVNESK